MTELESVGVFKVEIHRMRDSWDVTYYFEDNDPDRERHPYSIREFHPASATGLALARFEARLK